MAQLNIDYKPTDALIPRANNPRTHSETQIKQLVRSIEHFGFTNPVLIDGDGNLIAGHGRVEAAMRLGLKELPTICLTEMSEDDIRAYVITDNKLAEKVGPLLPFAQPLQCRSAARRTGHSLQAQNPAMAEFTVCGRKRPLVSSRPTTVFNSKS